MTTTKRLLLRRFLRDARAATQVMDKNHERIAAIVGPWVVCEVCDIPTNEHEAQGPYDVPLCPVCKEIKP